MELGTAFPEIPLVVTEGGIAQKMATAVPTISCGVSRRLWMPRIGESMYGDTIIGV